jgi:hypothetical protein
VNHHTPIYPDLPRAYIDMDGVSAHFVKGKEQSGLSFEQFEAMPGAFRNLPIFPGILGGLADLKTLGFYNFLLTRAPPVDINATAANDKLFWVSERLHELKNRVIITPDKGALGRPGDILIDDHRRTTGCRSTPAVHEVRRRVRALARFRPATPAAHEKEVDVRRSMVYPLTP